MHRGKTLQENLSERIQKKPQSVIWLSNPNKKMAITTLSPT
jgi:hypothetical protein